MAQKYSLTVISSASMEEFLLYDIHEFIVSHDQKIAHFLIQHIASKMRFPYNLSDNGDKIHITMGVGFILQAGSLGEELRALSTHF